MIETILLALSVLGIGAILVFAAAFVVLAATPLTAEGPPSRIVAPATAELWQSARGTLGAPEKTGLVNGLVRSLRSAREAIHGSKRDAIS